MASGVAEKQKKFMVDRLIKLFSQSYTSVLHGLSVGSIMIMTHSKNFQEWILYKGTVSVDINPYDMPYDLILEIYILKFIKTRKHESV